MASPPRLVETISQVTGMPLPTVVEYDRRLAKAGLRNKTGRGLHAARMTPLDAARLLTAVLASSQASVAVAAVERYTRTQVRIETSSTNLFGAAELEDLADLPATHSFIGGLVALITSASAGALARLAAGSEAGSLPRIEIYAFTRATSGRIRISGLPNGLTASVEYVAAPAGDRTDPAIAGLGDLEQSRQVTQQTIFAIASLLSEENHHERA